MLQNNGSGSLVSKIGSYLQIVSRDRRSTAFVPLAEAYRQIGLLDDALQAAKLGTQGLPHFSPGFSTLGRVLGQMGRIDEAMSAFAKALSIDRQSQTALVGLARLHLVRGERDQARRILNQAADFHPKDQHIRDMLIALDLPRPWDQIAIDPEGEPAPTEEPTAEEKSASAAIFTATLAEIYVKQGLIEKAIGVYQEILRRDPANQPARERLDALQKEDFQEEIIDAGVAAPAEMPEVDVLADQPDEGEPAAEISVPAATSDQGEPMAADEAYAEAEQVSATPLAILENWLSAIRQRRKHGREHVQ